MCVRNYGHTADYSYISRAKRARTYKRAGELVGFEQFMRGGQEMIKRDL